MTHRYLILVGSNSSDRKEKITAATDRIVRLSGGSAIVSQIIDSPDFSGVGADYLNVVILLDSEMNEDCLLELFDKMEISMGRNRNDPKTVSIDIDIVITDGIVRKPKEYVSDAFRIGRAGISGLTGKD